MSQGPLRERSQAAAGAATIPAQSAPAAIALAQAALQRGEWDEVVRSLEVAEQLAPGHPAVLMYLARGYTTLDRREPALTALERLGALGAVGLDADPALAALAGEPRYSAAAAAMARNSAPLLRSDTALLVPGPDRIPESIAHDPVSGDHFLGSLAENSVVRISPDGQVSPFITGHPGGQTVGIRVDSVRRWLWVAEAMRDRGAGGFVRAYSLTDGSVVRAYSLSGSERHLPNDLVVAPDGHVLVTDMDAGAVFRIDPTEGSVGQLVTASAAFHNPNGIALSPDGRRLYVAHMEGISLIDPVSGSRQRLSHPSTISAVGIDGLYACGDAALIAVQQGRGFHQIVRFQLEPGGTHIRAANVLERRHPAHDVPTTGVLVDDYMLYIANSQLHRLTPEGEVTPTDDPAPTLILRLPLAGICDR